MKHITIDTYKGLSIPEKISFLQGLKNSSKMWPDIMSIPICFDISKGFHDLDNLTRLLVINKPLQFYIALSSCYPKVSPIIDLLTTYKHKIKSISIQSPKEIEFDSEYIFEALLSIPMELEQMQFFSCRLYSKRQKVLLSAKALLLQESTIDVYPNNVTGMIFDNCKHMEKTPLPSTLKKLLILNTLLTNKLYDKLCHSFVKSELKKFPQFSEKCCISVTTSGVVEKFEAAIRERFGISTGPLISH